jgi:hypothetical protein
MPKGIMIVSSRPSDPAREDEYHDWYDHTHIPEILAIPGFVAARRYRAVDRATGEPLADGTWVAVYDIDADELTAPVRELGARSAAGEMSRSDALGTDPPPVVTLGELPD